jgi:RNA polymerase sigma-70 factor (ECF subfamily)
MADTTMDRCARRIATRHDAAPTTTSPTPTTLAAPTPVAAAEDADVRRRFRDGDPDAVRVVYAQFARPLYALCRSHLADVEQAKDAVQQTFLQAWRAAPSYDPDRPLAPWLFQIGRRVCIDRYRREKAVAERLDDHERHPALTVAGPSMERSWIVWEVRRAIEELPVDGREVIRLMHLDGYTVEQVAVLLSLPVGTVKSRSFRAHRKLVAMLGHLRAPDPELAA